MKALPQRIVQECRVSHRMPKGDCQPVNYRCLRCFEGPTSYAAKDCRVSKC